MQVSEEVAALRARLAALEEQHAIRLTVRDAALARLNEAHATEIARLADAHRAEIARLERAMVQLAAAKEAKIERLQDDAAAQREEAQLARLKTDAARQEVRGMVESLDRLQRTLGNLQLALPSQRRA